MAIPFRQCAFSIDLLTHSGEFSGVVSFTGQSVFYRRDKTFRVGAMADLPCKTSLAGAFKAMFARMADTGMPWRYAISLLVIGRQKFFGAQPRTEKAYPNGFNVEVGLMELASADHRRYRILAVPVRPTAS